VIWYNDPMSSQREDSITDRRTTASIPTKFCSVANTHCGLCTRSKVCYIRLFMIFLHCWMWWCSQLRPPMMTSLLRKLVIDVPALTENTITPLRVGHFTLPTAHCIQPLTCTHLVTYWLICGISHCWLHSCGSREHPGSGAQPPAQNLGGHGDPRLWRRQSISLVKKGQEGTHHF